MIIIIIICFLLAHLIYLFVISFDNLFYFYFIYYHFIFHLLIYSLFVYFSFFCSDLFCYLSVHFSLFDHLISGLGASENHRRTYGERSWRYGPNRVHIPYQSTRNTSDDRRSFFKKCQDVSQNDVGKPISGKLICHTWGRKPISGKLICPKWDRKTNFGPIHPHRGSNAGVGFCVYWFQIQHNVLQRI